MPQILKKKKVMFLMKFQKQNAANLPQIYTLKTKNSSHTNGYSFTLYDC